MTTMNRREALAAALTGAAALALPAAAGGVPHAPELPAPSAPTGLNFSYRLPAYEGHPERWVVFNYRPDEQMSPEDIRRLDLDDRFGWASEINCPMEVVGRPPSGKKPVLRVYFKNWQAARLPESVEHLFLADRFQARVQYENGHTLLDCTFRSVTVKECRVIVYEFELNDIRWVEGPADRLPTVQRMVLFAQG